MDVIFTIVSRNYAALAATLMDSLAVHEPQARRVVIATDGPMPQLASRAEVIDADTVCPDFAELCVHYEALELNTAVKPYVFSHFLTQPGVTSATYLDPDIFVFRPLTRIRDGVKTHDLVLTPHLLKPLMGTKANPNDQAILRSGVYNLGFASYAAQPKSVALARWWADRCRFDCRVDLENGIFTDQRWMDLSPGFVDSVDVIRDPGFNLAYWNLEGRKLERTAEGWQVDGFPLSFFHFSGFNPTKPKILSKHQDRLSVEPGSPLAELLADYAKALLANGYETSTVIPYAHNVFASGRKVVRPMRKVALNAGRAGTPYPSKLDAATEAWFDAPDPQVAAPGLPDLTRVMVQVWRDSPAADPFSWDTADGRLGFHQWFADNATALMVDDACVAAARRLLEIGAPVRQPDAAVWKDEPWTGPASEVGQWIRTAKGDLPRACLALLAARKELRDRFQHDGHGMLTWCLGPEAAAGRFAVDWLPDNTLDWLSKDAGPLFQAARFADAGPAGDLRRKLAVGFGVAERAGWPVALTEALRAPHLSPVTGLPAPYVRLFVEIWDSRADLQQLYPLTTAFGRLRYLRWLLAGGLAEYGVEVAALPERVRNNPMMRFAEHSVRKIRRPKTAAPAFTAAQLVVVETLEGADTPAEAVVYEAATGRFLSRDGHTMAAPQRVELVCFLTDPLCAPADVIALHARGVSWSRAVGVWRPEDVAALDDQSPALGCVDEIWASGVAVTLPRPIRPLEAGAHLQAAPRKLAA